MYCYKYTLEISSWSQTAQEYIVDLIKKYDVIYNIERPLQNNSKVLLSIKGKKEELDKLEYKLIKNLSHYANIDDFTKTTTEITDNMLVDNSFLNIESCEFSLIYKDKVSSEPIADAVKFIKGQKIGLIKNTNGYYICAISTKSAPLKKIREILQMPTQTLPILAKNLFQASKFITLSKKEESLLSSDIKPIIKSKKKPIHRLEKVKNIPVNAVAPSNIYLVKLPKNSLEEIFAKEVNLPLLFIRVQNHLELIDKVDFVLSFDKNFLEYEDSIVQMIYGKNQIIRLGYGLESFLIKCEKSFDKNIACITKNSIALGHKNHIKLSPCCIKSCEYFLLNDLKPEITIKEPTKNSVAIAHTNESTFKEGLVFEFQTDSAKIFLLKDKSLSLIAAMDRSPKEYFDSCALKAGLLKEINYPNESQMMCDSSYEICVEKSFDFELKDETISIDLYKDFTKNEISSALLNCFTNIVKEFVERYELPAILCGDLFENKNLTENIIEYFDDENKEFHISSNIPLNQTSAPLGTLLNKFKDLWHYNDY